MRPAAPARDEPQPHEPFGRLFLRFLRFGLLAWGGPVAQIAMIRKELVEEERWVSRDRFNRVLAVYQVLPGPEAHELCVYFGMLARGRMGGLLAGLAFMLPGFVLMLGLSWFYLNVGMKSPLFEAVFAGFQAAVVALIVRAVHRIGSHAVHDRWLFGIVAVALAASVVGVHFALTLLVAGAVYALATRHLFAPALGLTAAFCAGVLLYAITANPFEPGAIGDGARTPDIGEPGTVAAPELFASGLKAGLLTFGGAYTAIPFLQQDAVASGGWMANDQFLDGLALSGIIPAPLIIFSTFVGYFAGGPLGGVSMTVGIFLPAFAMTLLAHNQLERLIGNRSVHSFLDGVTAGVVGLIAATTLVLLRAGLTNWQTVMIFAFALAALYLWRAKIAVAAIVLGAGLLSLTLFAAGA